VTSLPNKATTRDQGLAICLSRSVRLGGAAKVRVPWLVL